MLPERFPREYGGLSPEQVRKEPLTPRTDLFALGCTLHSLLTGRPLLDLPKDAIFRTLHRGDVPPPDERLPHEAKQVITALTAADPAKRPGSAQEVSMHLRHLVGPAAPVRESLAARVREACEAMSREDAPAGTTTTTRETPIGTVNLTDTTARNRRR